jgi:hypothetical protein
MMVVGFEGLNGLLGVRWAGAFRPGSTHAVGHFPFSGFSILGRTSVLDWTGCTAVSAKRLLYIVLC